MPAIALTLAVDLWFTQKGSFDPATMAQFDNIPLHVGICATMTGYLWNANIHCFSNGPYWSLAYEVWFYVAFGVAVFAPTKMLKIMGTVTVLAVMGPKMVILMPC